MTTTRFRLCSQNFEWRNWLGQAVIYDDRTGATHKLVKPAGALLAVLAEEPQGLTWTEVVRRLNLENDTEAEQRLVQALKPLLALGIVQEAPFANR